MFNQNDGTLTTATEASRLPVKTFSSGATNSMRGASHLAGVDLNRKGGIGKSMIVVDIGGTTTDVGALMPSGFPRQAAAFIEGQLPSCASCSGLCTDIIIVAGVRTKYAILICSIVFGANF